MIHITGTADWHAAHPGAIIGLLEVSGVNNTIDCPMLTQRKREVEAYLRKDFASFSRKDLLNHPIMAAYTCYYKRFDKTYHVLLQVESIFSGGRNLPDVSPLVDANFTAEIATFLLTAGHDADNLVDPVVIDVSHQGESMTLLNGASKTIRAGDMAMRDSQRLCCTILYGQDNHSPITKATRHVLYVTYAPPGVPANAVTNHMQLIAENIRLDNQNAIEEQCQLLMA